MKKLSVIAVLLLVAGVAAAGSTNLTASKANDITLLDATGGAIGAGVVDVFDDGGNAYIINWRASTYSGYSEVAHELTLHNADGSFVRSLASFTGTAYKSFVRRSGSDVYFGLDANIYRVDYAAPSTPVVAAVLGNNYDMQFAPSGKAYAVANPTWGSNDIYSVDLTGGSSHTVVVANAGSYSAELAVNSSGDLYYGTYNFGPNEIRSFAAAQLDAAETTGAAAAWTDGTHVTDLPNGAGGMMFDAADNLVFTLNNFGGVGELCIIEAGETYVGPFAYAPLSGVNFFTTCVDALGDVTAFDSAGGAAYTAGGTVLSTVPEPTMTALLAVGLAAVVRRRRRD